MIHNQIRSHIFLNHILTEGVNPKNNSVIFRISLIFASSSPPPSCPPPTRSPSVPSRGCPRTAWTPPFVRFLTVFSFNPAYRSAAASARAYTNPWLSWGFWEIFQCALFCRGRVWPWYPCPPFAPLCPSRSCLGSWRPHPSRFHRRPWLWGPSRRARLSGRCLGSSAFLRRPWPPGRRRDLRMRGIP